MKSYEAECKPARWVSGEHDRELDYYEPAVLAQMAEGTEEVRTYRECGAGRPAGKLARITDNELEVIGRILRRLEGGMLKRKVRWVKKRRALKAGERVEKKRGAGEILCGGVLCEWQERAVIIFDSDGAAACVFAEAQSRGLRKAGWSGYKGEVVEIKVPELVASELDLRRISMNVAVLLRLYRGESSGFHSAAAIARATGVERATVSASQIRIAKEELAAGGVKFKAVRSRKVS